MATFERLAILVEANAGKAIAEFKQVGAAAKKLEGDAAGAGKGVGLLGRISGQAGGLMKVGIAAGVAGAGLALAKFAGDSIDAFTSLAGQVKQFQRVAGGTAEDSSRLVSTFRALNIDVDQATTFFGRFAKNVGVSGEGLAKVGVSAVRTAKGNVDMAKTFLAVVDAYNATSDAGQRATIGNAAFGRGWIALAPILAKGREGVEALYAEAERHGLILSEEDLSRAAELKVAMRDLHGAIEGIKVSAGRSLLPALTDFVELVDKAIDRIGDLQHPKEDSNSGWDQFTKGWKKAVDFVDQYMGGVQLFPESLDEGNKAIADSAKEAIENEQGLQDRVDEVSKAIFKSVDATDAEAAAKRSLTSANLSLADAQSDLNKLIKDGAVDEEKVADARRSLAEATRSLGHASRGLAKAQEEYNDAQAAFLALPSDTNADKLRDASDGLADAQDGVASAADKQKDAQHDLAKAQAGDPEFNDKLAAAHLKVEDAALRVSAAEKDWSEKSHEARLVHEAEAVAINGKADAVERLIADLKNDVFLHPNEASAINPTIAALQADQQPRFLGMHQLPAGTAGPPSPVFGTGPAAPTSVTNNVTVNVAASVADPIGIAKNIMWELN